MSEKAIKIFYSYSRTDQKLREKLDQHLAPLKYAGLISPWYDLLLAPGSDWKQDIGDHLDTADIILLLVSANFLSSEYCYSIELKRALERELRKEACVIPVILEPCDWRHEWVPFSKLTALPNHEKAITEWENREAAFTSVVQGIRLKVQALAQQRQAKEQETHFRAPKKAEQQAEKVRQIQQNLKTPIQIGLRQIPEKLVDLLEVTRKDLQDCDPGKIIFIKNVKHPELGTWAYPLEYMRQTESRTFELMWRASSHGVSQPKAEDLMILHQRARVTHVVEFLDDQVRETDTGFFRWVRAVWLPEQDWNQLPHQKEILGFSPKYADGNTHALNGSGFSTFREAWSSLEEFQKHIFKRLTQSETIVIDKDDLTSEKGVDYTRLRDLLKAGQWKEADQETADRMCEVMGRQDEGNLREEDVQNFPCRDLRTINLLWVKYSNNHFGFSVQRQIWQDIEATGQSDYNVYCSFGDSVGWRSPDGWKSYDEITFSLESPCGNLPWWGKQVTWIFGAKIGPYLSGRVDICKISG